MSAKHYPLPKRVTVSLSDSAYRRLRELNAQYGLGNNYLLTVLLENLDDIANADRMSDAFEGFISRYGAPRGDPR